MWCCRKGYSEAFNTTRGHCLLNSTNIHLSTREMDVVAGNKFIESKPVSHLSHSRCTVVSALRNARTLQTTFFATLYGFLFPHWGLQGFPWRRRRIGRTWSTLRPTIAYECGCEGQQRWWEEEWGRHRSISRDTRESVLPAPIGVHYRLRCFALL